MLGWPGLDLLNAIPGGSLSGGGAKTWWSTPRVHATQDANPRFIKPTSRRSGSEGGKLAPSIDFYVTFSPPCRYVQYFERLAMQKNTTLKQWTPTTPGGILERRGKIEEGGVFVFSVKWIYSGGNRRIYASRSKRKWGREGDPYPWGKTPATTAPNEGKESIAAYCTDYAKLAHFGNLQR